MIRKILKIAGIVLAVFLLIHGQMASWEDYAGVMADLYGTTVDNLVRTAAKVGNTVLSPGPKGKHIFGTVKVNCRGQIVILKAAREIFDIKKDDTLVVLGDESEGIALIKTEVLEKRLNAFYDCSRVEIDE